MIEQDKHLHFKILVNTFLKTLRFKKINIFILKYWLIYSVVVGISELRYLESKPLFFPNMRPGGCGQSDREWILRAVLPSIRLVWRRLKGELTLRTRTSLSSPWSPKRCLPKWRISVLFETNGPVKQWAAVITVWVLRTVPPHMKDVSPLLSTEINTTQGQSPDIVLESLATLLCVCTKERPHSGKEK